MKIGLTNTKQEFFNTKSKNDMMKVFYILFFILLDFLAFNFLVQKIKLNIVVKSVCVIFLLLIIMIHLLRFSDFLLPDKVFLILIFFTAGLFVFHIGKEISIWITVMFHNREKSELLLKWFKIWTDYIIYFMVLLFQITTIINYEDILENEYGSFVKFNYGEEAFSPSEFSVYENLSTTYGHEIEHLFDSNSSSHLNKLKRKVSDSEV